MKSTKGGWYWVLCALLLFGCGESPPPPKPAVSYHGSRTLAIVALADAHGSAWVPVMDPRVKAGEAEATDEFIHFLLTDWQRQLPNREFVLAEPVTDDQGEVNGYRFKYRMR